MKEHLEEEYPMSHPNEASYGRGRPIEIFPLNNRQQSSPSYSNGATVQRHSLMALDRGTLGGLGVKPKIRVTDPRQSLGALQFAERAVADMPLCPTQALQASAQHPLTKQDPVRRAPRKSLPPRAKASSSRAAKRAVLVGINYAGTPNMETLEGSDKDVSILHELLTSKLGFQNENIWVLTDKPRAVVGAAVRYLPTRENVLNSVKWLVCNSRRGDKLMFSFSGHGQREKDEYSKPVPRSECILASDFPMSDPITAEEIHKTLVQDLPDGATLTALFDCRYSAGIMQLPFMYASFKTGKGSFTLCETAEGPNGETVVVDAKPVRRLKMLLRRERLEARKRVALQRRENLAASCFANGTVVCISSVAEQDKEGASSLAADFLNSALTTAFVRYLKHCISTDLQASYNTVLCAMSAWMAANGITCLPQLSCSHSLSPDSTVALLDCAERCQIVGTEGYLNDKRKQVPSPRRTRE